MGKKACLIYDVDGVLFDVSHSFHSTIIETVCLYTTLFWSIDIRKWMGEEILSSFKQKGGFNDDWELSAAILILVSSVIDKKAIKAFNQLKKDTSCIDIETIMNICYTTLFSQKKGDDLPFEKLTQMIKNIPPNQGLDYFYSSSSDDCFFPDIVFFNPSDSADNISENNYLKRLFQEIYLGPLFHEYYGKKRALYHGPAKCINEKRLLSHKLLEKLNQSFQLSIATGRDRKDLNRSLKNHQMDSFFEYTVTCSELEVKEKKPHPQSLRMIQNYFKNEPIQSWFYVGDQVDDMIMANTMKKELPSLKSIAFIEKGDPKEELFQKLNVDLITNQHNKIETWLKEQIEG